MHSYLARLETSHTVLDLGCGGGSFHYENYAFQVIATDVRLPVDTPREHDNRVHYIRSDSSGLPLADASVDAVLCHNTLEHFPAYELALSEIRRVLRPDGWLWIAVPNGYGFDDALYRLLFEGGGHVNRFTYAGLISDVHRITGFELVDTCDLYSGFVFLRKPSDCDANGYPATAHFLANIPEGFLTAGAVAVNTVTRLIDKWTGSRYSQYGWGFVFAKGPLQKESLPHCFNVCRRCGCGCNASETRRIAGRLYACRNCGELNVLIKPPAGLD